MLKAGLRQVCLIILLYLLGLKGTPRVKSRSIRLTTSSDSQAPPQGWLFVFFQAHEDPREVRDPRLWGDGRRRVVGDVDAETDAEADPH